MADALCFLEDVGKNNPTPGFMKSIYPYLTDLRIPLVEPCPSSGACLPDTRDPKKLPLPKTQEVNPQKLHKTKKTESLTVKHFLGLHSRFFVTVGPSCFTRLAWIVRVVCAKDRKARNHIPKPPADLIVNLNTLKPQASKS